MFPGPRLIALIVPEGSEARHEQPADAVRAQAKVRLVEASGGRGAGQPAIESLREAGVALGRSIVVVVV
jgi:hypothetical protein